MLIEEFDPSPSAIIEPHNLINPLKDQMPEIVVSCFEHSVFERLLSINGGTEITYYSTPKQKTPIYCTLYKGKKIALTLMDIGAAACVCFCEVLYAMGAKMIILFGSCGVLDCQISRNSIIIPNYALRDEGVSFHYMPPADEISVNSEYIKEFTALLTNEQIEYSIGKVWTTDALFRETKEKVRQRKMQGCICVDMECSAVASMAKFRKKGIFHFFYAADSLDNDEWDRRAVNKQIRRSKSEAVAYIAMEFALRCTI